jgi:2Fe-2S ferredoxin
MQIRFAKSFPAIQANDQDSIMELVQGAGHPVASSCGGEGICTKCKIQVIEGTSNLSELTFTEQTARLKGLIQSHERLSCQARLHKDHVKIDTTYW